MLDCEGAVSPKAGLVRKELLINVSEIPNWKDEWKTTMEKKELINQPEQSLAEILWPSISVLQRKKEGDY